MCNIAGYVGERAAAPILIEMLRAQEGFDAGYYSGIATIHEGKIYHAKITGNVQRLIDNTDAASLPGNIGIIHGRSGQISGDDRWAHPFIAGDDEAEIAYIANGVIGFAANRREEYGRLADQLACEGFSLSSKLFLDHPAYNKLSDGTTAHMSDVMCQLIFKHMKQGKEAHIAMADSFCEMPSGIVGLLLSRSVSDKIFFSRIDRPMFVSYGKSGVFLGTTAIAFPEDVSEPQLLPALSSGYVSQNGVFSLPFKNPPCTVAHTSARIRRDAYDAICEELRQGNLELWDPVASKELGENVRSMFDKADCIPAAALIYEILYSLYKEGKLDIKHELTPTSVEEVNATRFKLGLK